MRKILRTVPVIACLIISNAAAQQLEGGWLIETSNIVSPSQPTTTVEVWAWYDNPQGDVAFAIGDFDLSANDGVFSNIRLSMGFDPGTANGNTVVDVLVGQIWGVLGWVPNTANPILVWSADWTTTDFLPRSVGLDTLNTTDFRVGDIRSFALTQLYPQGFTLGTGVIEVVPSPASAVPMVVVGAVMLRRRR